MLAEFTLKSEGRFLGPGLSTPGSEGEESGEKQAITLVISSKKDTGVPSYLRDLCSKAPSGCLKPQVSERTEPYVHCAFSYTYVPLIKFNYKLSTVKDEQ